jgi:hypothetical protein
MLMNIVKGIAPEGNPSFGGLRVTEAGRQNGVRLFTVVFTLQSSGSGDALINQMTVKAFDRTSARNIAQFKIAGSFPDAQFRLLDCSEVG